MAAVTIFFGYENIGVVTIVMKRLSDGKFWNQAAGTWDDVAPTPLEMIYDADIGQYTTTASPTGRIRYTAYDDGDVSIMYGEAGGDIPSVAIPASASTYTVAEIISRIRVDVRDPDGDRYTDDDILAILDKCVGWLNDLAFKTKSALGALLAIYTGDGATKEFDAPSDWRGWKHVLNPATDLGGVMHFVPKAVYDIGRLAIQAGSHVVAWTMLANKLYFISDPIVNGKEIYTYYYPRAAKLAAIDAIPFDGVFMELMVQWSTVNILAKDEYVSDIEKELLVEMMSDAKAFMDEHRDWPQEIQSPKQEWIDANQKSSRKQRY